MVLVGAHGITIALFGSDLPSAAAFHGVVTPKDNRRPWGPKARDVQPKQNPTGLAGRPSGLFQDAMVVRKLALCRQPHHP